MSTNPARPARPAEAAVEAAPIALEPIGVVAGAGDDVRRVDWSGVRSSIVLRADLEPALLGLDGYSHVIVLAWLDRVPEELRGRLRARPAGDKRYPEQGALALRGPRPNPIGVTVCRLRSVEGATLHLEGLDLVDGTPVLDVKPYWPLHDAVPDARLPDWTRG